MQTRRPHTGGILGRAFTKSAIINCISEANVSANTTGSNGAYAGGIAEMTGNSTVMANCASFGDALASNVSGGADAYAGGLIGILTSTIYNCYATGNCTIVQKSAVVKQFVGALAAYVLMNIPYAEFYKAEIADGGVDAVTAATKNKKRFDNLAAGSYHTDENSDGIEGVVYPVYVSDLTAFSTAAAAKEAKAVTDQDKLEYQINKKAKDEVVNAVILTAEGKQYGLGHVVNIWNKANLGWNYKDANYSDLSGKTITNIKYFTNNGIYSYNVNAVVPGFACYG